MGRHSGSETSSEDNEVKAKKTRKVIKRRVGGKEQGGTREKRRSQWLCQRTFG